MGRQIDYSVNDGHGPYVFKMHGALIHKIGSLLPGENAEAIPAYSQLYLYDPQIALDVRMGHRWNSGLSRDVLGTLQDMLYRYHPAAELYKHAQELIAGISDEDDCQLSIHFDAACDSRCYNEPDAGSKEISIMILDEGYQAKDTQDIIIHLRDGPL